MKKITKKECKTILAGATYYGDYYYIGTRRIYCAHWCPSTAQRQHNVSGNTVTHICLDAP